MTLRCAFIMDPLSNLSVEKDSTLAMIRAAQAAGYQADYLLAENIAMQQGVLRARAAPIRVQLEQPEWYKLGSWRDVAMTEYDLVFLRKDPPFDLNYIYLTYFLEHLEKQGVLVVNRPGSVRDANEKCFPMQFSELVPAGIYTANLERLHAFVDAHEKAVVKPLDGMGGAAVFCVNKDDPNRNVILETITQFGSQWVLMQEFIEEVRAGDKRIVMINGEPVPYALARIPAPDDFRGNLAKGAKYEGRELTSRDREICQQVGPVLREHGLYFVGLDVIGDYLTEVNVTSPTCIRQLDDLFSLDIAAQLLECVAALRT